MKLLSEAWPLCRYNVLASMTNPSAVVVTVDTIAPGVSLDK